MRTDIMTTNAEQGMNGVENNMRTAQQTNGTGRGSAKLLRTVILGLTLTLGLTLGNGSAQAEEGDRDTRQVQRNDREQGNGHQKGDNDRQDKRDDRDHADDSQPTITLTAPATGSAKLYPAAFELEAAVSFPGKAEGRNDQREGVEIEFLVDGQKFAEAERAPYSASYTPPRAGLYTLSARIHYGEGKRTIQSNSVEIVSDLPPTVNLTTPANNTVQTAPANFTLTADAAAPIGSIAKVEYYNGATLIGTATNAPYSFDWTNVAAGSYTITAKATDNYGFSSTSAAVSVIANAPPTVSLTSPAPNTVSTAPGSFTLSADVTDADGTIAKVEFFNGTTLLGTATVAPYSYTWANVPVGSYTITAKATDNYGFSSTSAPVTVISNAPPTVSVTSPAPNTVSTAPGSFTLSADAADSDGTIAKVEFYAGNGTTNTLIGSATAAPYAFDWTNVPAGNYSLTAIATDNHGGQTTSPMISLTAIANVPPTVSLTGPANGTTMKVPGSFTLTADAASTTSTVAKVDFYAIDNATNAGTLIGTAIQAPYTANWSNVPLGSYTLSAVATDTLGAVTTSSQVSVTVNTGIAQAYYIHTDHLDTPRTITDTVGNIVWQWDNGDPFGNNMPNENPAGLGQFKFDLRFPGQYFDRETNTHYNFHRDYDPATGRYLAADPRGQLLDFSDPARQVAATTGIDIPRRGKQFWYLNHSYTYVDNNLVNRVDPTGEIDPLTAGFVIWGFLYVNHAGDAISDPNGNVWGEPQDQDNVCTLPFPIGTIANQCVLGHCQRHDACYDENGCTASSWVSSVLGGTKSCNQCNSGFFQ